jgi:hypothetical protein
MTTGTQLLERVSEQAPEHVRFVPLQAIFSPLRCARFPPRQPVATSAERETPEQLRVLFADDVRQFDLWPRQEWVQFSDLRQAFARSRATSNISLVSWEVLDAPVKLVLRDLATPLRGALTADLIYPKRAWIGALLPGWDTEMAFAVAGILNSAIGYLLYNARARERGIQDQDLRGELLGELPIPLPGAGADSLSRLALLSYRLHALHETQRVCAIDLDTTLTSHWLSLLSEVVRLYGWSEEEARDLLFDAQTQGLRDIPGYQGELLFERGDLQSPSLRVRLVPPEGITRYEELKAELRAGRGEARAELGRLQTLLQWEHRINAPVPKRLPRAEWPGASNEREALRAAFRYLSMKRGQAFGAQNPRRIDERLWEVQVYYSPPARLSPADVRRLPAGWAEPGKHAAGHLLIDAITGEVHDAPAEADRASPA